jgi:hypothetical protein
MDGNVVELSRHAGMDCRHPGHRDVIRAGHPWPLGSGNPCRNDGPKLISTTLRMDGSRPDVRERGGGLDR